MKRRRDRGFTLPELMIAGSTASFLLLVMWELLLQGSEIAAENEARARMNDQARQAMVMLTYGGTASGGATGNDGTGLVPGVKTAGQNPSGALRDEGRLRVGGNGLTILSDEGPETQTTCLGPLIPLAECVLPGQIVVHKGWFESNPTLTGNIRSVDNETTEIGVEVTDARQKGRDQRRNDSETEDYWTITTRMTEGEN